MVLKLYYTEQSPAVRGSLLTIKALGLDVQLNPVNLRAGEHLTPKYLEINPLHTVPTMEDDGLIICDSHAINTYLVGKYAKDDSLYPKDFDRRAVIDQCLHFDCGVLFRAVRNIVVAFVRQGAKAISKEHANALTQGYTCLETLLEQSTYVAGEQLSLADFSIIANITTANVLIPICPEKYPKITEWIARMKDLPFYAEANQPGLEKFEELARNNFA